MTFRNLALIKRSGSTSRILNLHIVHELFGATEAFSAQPLFLGKNLNRSLIMKHTLRGADRYLFQSPRHHATKIIFPFAQDDLTIGGSNIFIGQKNFEAAVRDFGGGYKDEASLRKDIELLLALDKLPSLDPFLLREQLRVMGRVPARCYFQISDSDLSSMQSFVSEQVNGLIGMALGDNASAPASADVSRQMATKILSDENAEVLAPLKAALGLGDTEWADGVFCWKGFLYYKWTFAAMQARSASTLEQMLRVNFAKCDAISAATIQRSRSRAEALLREKMRAMRKLLNIYDVAYKMLTVDKKPAAFKEFLLNSPQTFLEIGETAGVINHIAGFWAFKCGRANVGILQSRDLVEVFQEFENCAVEGGSDGTEVGWRALA